MAPFTGKAAICHVVAIVRGIDDHGIVSQTLLFEGLDQLSDHPVYAAEHAKIGTHVGLIFIFRIPAPVEAFPIHGCLQEVREGVKVFGIRQIGGRHGLTLVEITDPFGIRIMSHTGCLVAVLGMRRVKTHGQTEGAIVILCDKTLGQIPHHIRTFATGPVRLLQVTGTRHGFVKIEHGLALLHAHAKLANETRSIA